MIIHIDIDMNINIVIISNININININVNIIIYIYIYVLSSCWQRERDEQKVVIYTSICVARRKCQAWKIDNSWEKSMSLTSHLSRLSAEIVDGPRGLYDTMTVQREAVCSPKMQKFLFGLVLFGWISLYFDLISDVIGQDCDRKWFELMDVHGLNEMELEQMGGHESQRGHSCNCQVHPTWLHCLLQPNPFQYILT